jgi:hypothetical protein
MLAVKGPDDDGLRLVVVLRLSSQDELFYVVADGSERAAAEYEVSFWDFRGRRWSPAPIA